MISRRHVEPIIETNPWVEEANMFEDRCACDEYNKTHPCPNQEGVECTCCPYCTSNCAGHLAKFFKVEEEDILSGKVKIVREWSEDFAQDGVKAVRRL